MKNNRKCAENENEKKNKRQIKCHIKYGTLKMSYQIMCFIYRRLAFFPAFEMHCSDVDGDIEAIGVCELSRYKRSLTRSLACLKNITASSCVIGHNGKSLT